MKKKPLTISRTLNLPSLILVVLLGLVLGFMAHRLPEKYAPQRIAYINADSLLAHYQMAIDLRNQLEIEGSRLQEELKEREQAFYKEYQEAQNQAMQLSRKDQEILGQQLEQKQEELLQFQQQAQAQITQLQHTNDLQLETTIRAYLDQYNSTKNYDYILNYNGSISNIILANKAFDITQEVLEQLNLAYQPINE